MKPPTKETPETKLSEPDANNVANGNDDDEATPFPETYVDSRMM